MTTRKDSDLPKRRPPATTPEARENQLIGMAVNLAEKQLADGTASSQVISHFLKLGSTKERLEKDKLTSENELLKAKIGAIASGKNVEELYKKALSSFRTYSGQSPEEEDEDYD